MHDLRRQSMLFDTSKLRSASVGILGSGPVANYLSAYLSGLGIGRIFIVDNQKRKRSNPKEFLIELSGIKGTKLDRISDVVRKINKDIMRCSMG